MCSSPSQRFAFVGRNVICTTDYLSRSQVIARRFTINMLEFQNSKNESKAMKKQVRNHVNCKQNGSGRAPAKSTGVVSGEFVTATLEYNGGRQVTVYVPRIRPKQSSWPVMVRDLEVGPVAREGRRAVHNDRRCT